MAEPDKTDPLEGLCERELRVTAVLYARMGAAESLRKTGKLPDKIGGPWNVIPMRLTIEERGTDPTLTPDEQLVYEAIRRERRLPGGAIRLVDKAAKRESKVEDVRKSADTAQADQSG